MFAPQHRRKAKPVTRGSPRLVRRRSGAAKTRLRNSSQVLRYRPSHCRISMTGSARKGLGKMPAPSLIFSRRAGPNPISRDSSRRGSRARERARGYVPCPTKNTRHASEHHPRTFVFRVLRAASERTEVTPPTSRATRRARLSSRPPGPVPRFAPTRAARRASTGACSF